MTTYAVLQETNGRECESWLTFIKYEGNEQELSRLQSQLDQVEWYILDALSVFDLDLKHRVIERTAWEICRLNLNHTMRHRKFDGKMQNIDFKFKSREKNDRRIYKVFEELSYGQIEKFVNCEDIQVKSPTSRRSRSPSRSSQTKV